MRQLNVFSKCHLQCHFCSLYILIFLDSVTVSVSTHTCICSRCCVYICIYRRGWLAQWALLAASSEAAAFTWSDINVKQLVPPFSFLGLSFCLFVCFCCCCCCCCDWVFFSRLYTVHTSVSYLCTAGQCPAQLCTMHSRSQWYSLCNICTTRYKKKQGATARNKEQMKDPCKLVQQYNKCHCFYKRTHGQSIPRHDDDKKGVAAASLYLFTAHLIIGIGFWHVSIVTWFFEL